jgi:colicin import membrane protein
MRSGVVISSTLHASVFALGLVSFSTPEPFETREVESVQIELVPISEVAQAVQGAQEAPLINTPNPEETQNDTVADNAENVGEAQDDLKSVRADQEAFTPNQETAPPKVEEQPEPAPRVSNEPDPAEQAAPAPATEVAERAQESVQPQETQPEETPDPTPVDEPVAEAIASLPETVAVPRDRPEPPKAQKATTPDRKVPETETANATTAPKQQSNTQADEIAALVNREKSRAGGAKRVSGQKSLGTQQKSTGERLTRGELAALREHYESCFQIGLLENFAGVDEVTVTVTINYSESGQIVGRPDASSSGGSRTAQSHARRSILRDMSGCTNPPLPGADKYSTWSQIKLNFSLSEILNAGF